jgi:hypothetical protein
MLGLTTRWKSHIGQINQLETTCHIRLWAFNQVDLNTSKKCYSSQTRHVEKPQILVVSHQTYEQFNQSFNMLNDYLGCVGVVDI